MRLKLLVGVALASFALLAPANGFASSVSVVVENGIGSLAYFAGAGESNDIEIANSARTMTIVDTGATISAGSGCSQVNANEVSCFPVDVAEFFTADLDDKVALTEGDFTFDVFGGSEADELSVCPQCHATLIGGPGNDTLIGGDMGSTFFGETGDDTITGGSAGDEIGGGAGSDTIAGGGGRDLIKPSSGGDHVNGGGGTDVLDLSLAPSPINVDLRAGTVTGWGTKVVKRVEGVIGSPHTDQLRGDGASNRLIGLGGADVIAGRGGGDTLDGGGGKDRMFGNAGADTLRARDGMSDLVDGGRGSDRAAVDPGDRRRSIEHLF